MEQADRRQQQDGGFGPLASRFVFNIGGDSPRFANHSHAVGPSVAARRCTSFANFTVQRLPRDPLLLNLLDVMGTFYEEMVSGACAWGTYSPREHSKQAAGVGGGTLFCDALCSCGGSVLDSSAIRPKAHVGACFVLLLRVRQTLLLIPGRRTW